MSSTTKTFVLSIANEATRNRVEQYVMTLVSEVQVDAYPLAEVLTEVKTRKPRVVIADDFGVLEQIMADPNLGSTAVLWVSDRAPDDKYLDEVVSGKLNTIKSIVDETALTEVFQKALQFSYQFGSAEFKVKQIKRGEKLFSQGDQAAHVYLLKRGRLEVYQPINPTTNHTLGFASPGDFVGEMAYFNNEPRTATIQATEDSELIEIPIRNFEAVLMEKPSWCRKLLQSMSKRLKAAIQRQRQEELMK